MKTFVAAVLLALLPSSLDAGNLITIRVLHEKVNGQPTQTIRVTLWPDLPDRALHVSATTSDVHRASTVRMYGSESSHTYYFTWRLPPTVMRDEATEPYTVIAQTLDADGNVTGKAMTHFFVTR